VLRNTPVKTHLHISRAGEIALANETIWKLADAPVLADASHRIDDVAAPLASGLVIALCSVRTMSEIATGVTTTLFTRAADVTLKKRRRLVLMVRETPLLSGHLRTKVSLAELGAVIAPSVPGFHIAPQCLEDLIDHTIGRVLDLFGIDAGLTVRRKEPQRRHSPSLELCRPFVVERCHAFGKILRCPEPAVAMPFHLDRH
jgi:flavin prenyltransferase